MQREQLFGADLHAVATGGAAHLTHYRQAVLVHFDGIEIAGARAIRQTEAPPTAPFASARNQRGRTAGWQTRITGFISRYVGAARARQPRHSLLFRPRVHL